MLYEKHRPKDWPGVIGQPIEVYRRWFRDNGLNLRAAIQYVEAGGMLI